MEYLKILIPFDFSEQSRFAVDYAADFTANFDVEILLLHVLELSAFADVNREGHFEDLMGINTEMLEMQRKTAVSKMTALRDELQGRFPKLAAHIKMGPLTETILSFARRRKVDLILMGTKGAESLRSWISGSETQVIARRSEIPVCSVMTGKSKSEIDDILFISDFKDTELAPDPVITKLVRGLGARLHLLYICDKELKSDEAVREMMTAYINEHGLDPHELHIHHESSVVEGIHHFGQMDEMDLIALGTHGRKGINHLIRGSIAEKLINHLHKPVLVYRI